jgi:hypothetical protein
MRLVESSVPGAVERDTALHLLSQRAVLTRMLCRELAEAKGRLPDRRVSSALSMLLSWITQNFPESIWSPLPSDGREHPRPSDGLDQMAVSDEGRGLLEEVREGTRVGEALFMVMTTDSSTTVLQERLDTYWAKRAVAIRPPWFVDGKWPSSENDEVGTTDR